MAGNAGLPSAHYWVMVADDATLVVAARRRDAAGRAAFATLVRRHQPMLRRACLRVAAGDEALAADAAQEAVLHALLGLDRLRDPGAFGAWLTGIGLNAGRRLAGCRGHGPDGLDALAADEPSPGELAERAATVARVRDAIAALPAGQRDAVTLFYLAGLSQAEVAEHLGTAEGAVRTRLHKARAALRGHLHDLREKEPPMPADAVEMQVADVRPTEDDRWSATHVVILQDSGGERRLPIWIDTPEAVALVAALESVDLPRPGTYALSAALLAAAGRAVREVRVSRLVDGVFYAEVVLDDGASVDARPSDALNLALRTGARIIVDGAVLAAADEPLPEGPPGRRAIAAALRERLA